MSTEKCSARRCPRAASPGQRAIVSENRRVANDASSIAATTNVHWPVDAGVPSIAPDGESVNPGGRVHDVTRHVAVREDCSATL